MSRCTAVLLLFAFLASPAFAADPPAESTLPAVDIDPATGLARTTVVRPYNDTSLPRQVLPAQAGPPRPIATARPHVALILPIASPALGRLADAVRAGFMAAESVAGKESLPVVVTAIDNEDAALTAACRQSQENGAMLVVGGFTRDGAQALVNSECARQPVLALNELRSPAGANVYSFSLSLDNEARQAALQAVADGWRQAVVIGTNSPLSRRVQEAFEREWTRAAGEIRRLTFSGNLEEAAAIREKLAAMRADMVFFALDQPEARAVRPYVSGMLPIYATSLSVNPRAEAIVNVDLQGVRYVEMPWFVNPDHIAVMAYPPPPSPLNVESERLYAFGIDAFRLALQIARGNANAPLDGVTGRITLEDRHFARALSPAEVDGGRVIPLRTVP
ncbi:MAG: penicillin-binding protein activator [Usitatibacter sp.]